MFPQYTLSTNNLILGGISINNLLLIEDNLEIAELVEHHLMSEGLHVLTANDGEGALNLFFKNQFDLILLDLMLPKLPGKEVLRKIREHSSIPILIISAKDSEFDKILGLELGADDYITKPFSLLELTARVQAALRRVNYYTKNEDSKSDFITLGPFTLNFDTYQLFKDDEPINLTAKEFEILKLFFENPKKVFTKAQIFSRVWEDDFIKDENTVMVHIRRLREKIEIDPSAPKYIKTIWGIGYKLGDI